MKEVGTGTSDHSIFKLGVLGRHFVYTVDGYIWQGINKIYSMLFK